MEWEMSLACRCARRQVVALMAIGGLLIPKYKNLIRPTDIFNTAPSLARRQASRSHDASSEIHRVLVRIEAKVAFRRYRQERGVLVVARVIHTSVGNVISPPMNGDTVSVVAESKDEDLYDARNGNS